MEIRNWNCMMDENFLRNWSFNDEQSFLEGKRELPFFTFLRIVVIYKFRIELSFKKILSLQWCDFFNSIMTKIWSWWALLITGKRIVWFGTNFYNTVTFILHIATSVMVRGITLENASYIFQARRCHVKSIARSIGNMK